MKTPGCKARERGMTPDILKDLLNEPGTTRPCPPPDRIPEICCRNVMGRGAASLPMSES